MNFEWLAALAYPRAIAPHPNFPNNQDPTGPQQLASAILQESRALRKTDANTPSNDHSFAQLCVAALLDVDDDSLNRLASTVNDTEIELGQRACAALVVAAVGLETTLPSRDMFAGLITETDGQGAPEAKLVSLWLKLASAVLQMHYGEDIRSQFRAVRQGLHDLELQPRGHFLVNTTLGLDPTTVLQRILEMLVDAAVRWEVQFEPLGSELRKDLFRRATPFLVTTLKAHSAAGFGAWTKREFQESFQHGTRVFGASLLPGDASLLTPVLISQLCFHPVAKDYALTLGRSRFLRGQDLRDDGQRFEVLQSALALLRFGESRKEVRLSVRHTLRHGPLSALLADVEKVLRNIELRDRSTLLEIEYLIEAASLLDERTAGALFDRFSSEFSGERLEAPERWTATWERTEAMAHLMGALAGPAARQQEFVALIGERLRASNSWDETEDRALARAVRAAPGLTDPQLRQISLMVESISHFPEVRSVLRDRTSRWGEFFGEDADESELQKAVRYVNSIMGGARPSKADAVRYVSAVSIDLSRLTNEARGGAHSFGGIDPLDVATAFAIEAQHTELWPPIVDALSSPFLLRTEKISALSRLARSARKVPEAFRASLSLALPSLLYASVGAFDDETRPFPEALGAANALGLIESREVIASVSPWLSSTKSAERQHAVAVLGSFPVSESDAWVIQCLFTCTFDSDPDVQASAVQALTHLYPRWGALQDMLIERVNSLLSRDGTWLLRMVVAQLATEDAAPLRGHLRGRLESLTRHVDWRVRRAAVEVVAETFH